MIFALQCKISKILIWLLIAYLKRNWHKIFVASYSFRATSTPIQIGDAACHALGSQWGKFEPSWFQSRRGALMVAEYV